MLAFLLCSVPSNMVQAADKSGNLSLVAQTSSDWIYHGTSETLGEPTIGLNAEWQTPAGVFVGIEAHVAEQSNKTSDRQRQRSVMAYLGRGFEWGTDWFATVTLAHREFPGSAKEWDFTELGFNLNHSSGLDFTVDYSPDYYEHNTPSVAFEARYSKTLGKQSYWYAEAGLVELTASNTFDDHHYAALGFGASVKSINFDLAYRWNNRGSSSNFGREAFSPSQFVFQFSYRVR